MNTKIKMQFDPAVAAELDVNCAIMLSNIEFWVEHNKANNKNKHDGRYWTYNSMEAFKELFPFWSVGQIRRILDKLKSSGYLITGNFNKVGYDRTIWYSVQMHLSKSANGVDEISRPIPDNKPNDKPDSIDIEKYFESWERQLGYKIVAKSANTPAIQELLSLYGGDGLLGYLPVLRDMLTDDYAPQVSDYRGLLKKMNAVNRWRAANYIEPSSPEDVKTAIVKEVDGRRVAVLQT